MSALTQSRQLPHRPPQKIIKLFLRSGSASGNVIVLMIPTTPESTLEFRWIPPLILPRNGRHYPVGKEFAGSRRSRRRRSKTFADIIKYIKMTASSNFGNVFSVLIASIFLPFLPMLPIQLLVQNLLYDISQVSIPWDELMRIFSNDRANGMLGALRASWCSLVPSVPSSISLRLVMWNVFARTVRKQSLFQSGWFVVGLLTQTLIVHMIRTQHIPFIQSWAATPVILLTASIMAFGMYLPFSSLGAHLGMVPLPLPYFPWLAGILLSYCVLTQLVKTVYFASLANGSNESIQIRMASIDGTQLCVMTGHRFSASARGFMLRTGHSSFHILLWLAALYQARLLTFAELCMRCVLVRRSGSCPGVCLDRITIRDRHGRDVRYWHKADIACALHMSAFDPKRTSCAPAMSWRLRLPPKVVHDEKTLSPR